MFNILPDSLIVPSTGDTITESDWSIILALGFNDLVKKSLKLL